MKRYIYKRGDRTMEVRCPFCGKLNRFGWEFSGRFSCSHLKNTYAKEYPSALPDDQYTRAFAFEKEN